MQRSGCAGGGYGQSFDFTGLNVKSEPSGNSGRFKFTKDIVILRNGSNKIRRQQDMYLLPFLYPASCAIRSRIALRM